MQFEEQILISAPVGKIFALYSNVNGWSSWDPDVKTSAIEGAFVSGANGTLEPSEGPEVNITIVSVQKDKSFTMESKLPLCTMTFEHELSPLKSATQVIHRVSFEGLLAFFFGKVIGNQIHKGLPGTLRGLKRAAESTDVE